MTLASDQLAPLMVHHWSQVQYHLQAIDALKTAANGCRDAYVASMVADAQLELNVWASECPQRGGA